MKLITRTIGLLFLFTLAFNTNAQDLGNTRYKITSNLALDIEGNYPQGFSPKWKYFSSNHWLNFEVDNYIVKRPLSNTERKTISIGSYKGKTILRFSAFINSDCYCDIKIADTLNIITNSPQTFKLSNFRKITNEKMTDEKCIGRSIYTKGGWKGKIKLSANKDGDIDMSLTLEVFKNATRFAVAGVSYRYNAKHIIIENEMSANNANRIVEEERIAKENLKNYLEDITKQADSIQEIIKKEFPQQDVRDCFYSSTGTYVVDEEGSNDWRIDTKADIKNTCDFDIKFIGIKQLKDKKGNYYLKLVAKTMPKDYEYSIEQTAASAAFLSLIGLQKGPEFNFKLQNNYYPKYARTGLTQWLRAIKSTD